MTEKWSDIYSEKGLLDMIKNNEAKIKEKEKEFLEAETRYNPSMADWNRKEIRLDIEHMEREIKEWEEAIEEIKERQKSTN